MTERLGLILLDVTPGTGGEFDRSFLDARATTSSCATGPSTAGSALYAGTGCDMVDRAKSSIVFALDLECAQHRAILQRYRERHTTGGADPSCGAARPTREVRGAAHRVRGLGARADGGRARRVCSRRRGGRPLRAGCTRRDRDRLGSWSGMASGRWSRDPGLNL